MARLIAVLLLAGIVLGGSTNASDPPEKKPAAVLDQKAISELALEHSRARDALLAAEARLSLLMEKVFRSRLVVRYRGDLDSDYQLAAIELDLDGALAYRKEFERAASIQALKLFDGHLPPGRHRLTLRVYARGPDDPQGTQPGYFAGAGMAVHLRDNAVCKALFAAEQDGDTPGKGVQKVEEPDGSWEIEITASYETEAD
jgi:hypothetical protein